MAGHVPDQNSLILQQQWQQLTSEIKECVDKIEKAIEQQALVETDKDKLKVAALLQFYRERQDKLIAERKELSAQLGAGPGAAGTSGAGSAGHQGSELAGCIQKLTHVMSAFAHMLGWQTFDQFRYSASTTSSHRDEKFKERVVQAHGSRLGAPEKHLRCSVLNEYLPSHSIISAHLFKLMWAARVAALLGFTNINDSLNALPMNKFCEAAFDNGYLIFLWRPELRHHHVVAGTGNAMLGSSSPSLNPTAPAFVPGMTSTSQASSSAGSAGAGGSSQASKSAARCLDPDVMVTTEYKKGTLVAHYLGDPSLKAADVDSWPWGTASVTKEQRGALTKCFGNKTVGELFDGKPVTWVEKLHTRSYYRCFLFQARIVIPEALAHGRIDQDWLDERGINLATLTDPLKRLSPSGSDILQRFLSQLPAVATIPPGQAPGDEPALDMPGQDTTPSQPAVPEDLASVTQSGNTISAMSHQPAMHLQGSATETMPSPTGGQAWTEPDPDIAQHWEISAE